MIWSISVRGFNPVHILLQHATNARLSQTDRQTDEHHGNIATIRLNEPIAH